MANQTNIEFVTEFMEFGSPLKQVWLLDALDKWSNHLIENESDVLKEMENSFINGEAWIQCAKEFQMGYLAKYS